MTEDLKNIFSELVDAKGAALQTDLVEAMELLGQLINGAVQGKDQRSDLSPDLSPRYQALCSSIASKKSSESSFEELWTVLNERVQEYIQQGMAKAMENVVLNLMNSDLPLGDDFKVALPTSSETTNSAVEASKPVSDAGGDLPWIESHLCTACDECTNINKSIFIYDDKKLAIIKDPKGGPFRDIVKAAEKCSSRVIHPGTPLNSSEKGLAKWIKRAEKYQ